MDDRLIAWGRAVKMRNARRGWRAPPLWLFTDPDRTPDLLAVVARLPAGLCGVVLRHDAVAGRAALARRVARLCQARRIMLSVAGDPALARSLRACTHLRGGHGWPGVFGATASAHGVAELVRGRRAGALVFLSPALATASHPGARPLGVVRWGLMARAGGAHRAGGAVLALGGIDGASARRLPRFCLGAGAIGALAGLAE